MITDNGYVEQVGAPAEIYLPLQFLQSLFETSTFRKNKKNRSTGRSVIPVIFVSDGYINPKKDFTKLNKYDII